MISEEKNRKWLLLNGKMEKDKKSKLGKYVNVQK